MAGKAKKTAAAKGKGKGSANKAKHELAAKAKPKSKAKPMRAKAKPVKAKAKPMKAKAKPVKANAKPMKVKAKPMKATAPKARPKPKAPAPAKPSTDHLQGEILAMARQVYGDLTDSQLLALDPNDIDEMDPATFYEMVAEKYGVQADPSNQNFGGFGGPISTLIAFVAARWDGKTNADVPMPPQEWLDEFVHPATEHVPQQAGPQDEPALD